MSILNKAFMLNILQNSIVRYAVLAILMMGAIWGLSQILETGEYSQRQENLIYNKLANPTITDNEYSQSVQELAKISSQKEQLSLFQKSIHFVWALCFGIMGAGLTLYLFTKIDFVGKMIDDKDGYKENAEIDAYGRIVAAVIFGALLLSAFIFSPSNAKASTSDIGVNLIKSFEGFRSKAYKDAVGVTTIGWGHTATAKMGMIISKQEGELLLKKDLKRFESHVFKNVQRQLPIHQFDALVSFCYNVGYRISGELKQAINESNTSKVQYKLNLYVNAGGRRLAGLVRRRLVESQIYGGDERVILRYSSATQT